MQQFGFEQPDNTIRISDEEAQALIELHSKRVGASAQPNLRDLAAQLGINEAQAMALLTEVRAQMQPPSFAQPASAAHQFPQDRNISSSAWAVIALCAALVVVASGLLWFGIGGTRTVTYDSTPPMPPPPLEHPLGTIENIAPLAEAKAAEAQSKALEAAAKQMEEAARQLESSRRSSGR